MISQGKNIIIIYFLSFVLTIGMHAQQSIPAKGQQIEAAVMAAPQALQKGAKVYGYNDEGEWTTLREGDNALICIADDPQKSNFHVACYYKGLEPFMKRGRELRAQGLTRKEVDKKRREEVEAGTLNMPEKAMTLYSLSAEEGAYNYQTGTLAKGQPLTVVYVPFGTQKTTGMSTSPAGPGAPWLMEAGTPWAHIMIPGRTIGESTSSK
jgi:hypothetical protein